MNTIVPLTNLSFSGWYPSLMERVGKRTILEYALNSIGYSNLHFILRWEDSTKYDMENYLRYYFPSSNIIITKDRLHGAAEAILYAPLDGPTIVYEPNSILKLNLECLLGRMESMNADGSVAVYKTRKCGPKAWLGGYHSAAISRFSLQGILGLAGLYCFNGSHYKDIAHQIIEDELHLDYKEVGIHYVLESMIDNGAKILYHRVGRQSIRNHND